MTIRRTATDDAGDETQVAFTRFTHRPKWFVLAQTDGPAFELPAVPACEASRALATLEIGLVPFVHADGNTQGCATGRTVAVSPIAQLPTKTLVHELAHVLLGHTSEASMTDGESTPRDLREVEAEGVALLVLGALGLDGLEYCRGYIQHWLQGAEITSATPSGSSRRPTRSSRPAATGSLARSRLPRNATVSGRAVVRVVCESLLCAPAHSMRSMDAGRNGRWQNC